MERRDSRVVATTTMIRRWRRDRRDRRLEPRRWRRTRCRSRPRRRTPRPRAAAQSAARSHQPLRRPRFELVRLGRPPKNPAAIAAAAARDAAADAERDDAGVKNDAPERACRACASSSRARVDPITTALTRRRATPTRRNANTGSISAVRVSSGALPDGVLRVVRARGGCRRGGAGADAAEDERRRATATTIGRTKRR